MKTKIRIFFLKFLCICKNKLYFCITKTSLSYGVMVTQQILLLHHQNVIELWCNGNTTDSGPVILGSNPGSSTKPLRIPRGGFCLVYVEGGKLGGAVCPSGDRTRLRGIFCFGKTSQKPCRSLGWLLEFGNIPGSLQPIKNRDETARCSGPFRPFASVGPAGTPGRHSCYSCLSSCMRSISARVSGLWPRKRT